MSRIDVQTLVLAFERRIAALEKNPPDKVPTAVILNMLEKSIDEIIKDHFAYLVKVDMRKQIKNEFKEMKEAFIKKTLESILTDNSFQKQIEDMIKRALLFNINGKFK